MIIAYDLGTGGIKASLYDDELATINKTFAKYPTYYPEPRFHEQRPVDWFNAFIHVTRTLMQEFSGDEIVALALSGHSLVSVPLDRSGALLQDQVPIWSDSRAGGQTSAFFDRIDQDEWYCTTGNGFPAPCYSLFKLMWLRENDPGVFSRIHTVLGSKDYINYRLTGVMATDPSYASGSGCFDLLRGTMDKAFLDAAGVPADFFPKIIPSHAIAGELTSSAAETLGLPAGIPVACGGVDNACMALGAVGIGDGEAYASIGSSCWIPVNSHKPILDSKKRPYVFAHIQEGMYTSAFSIFSGGTSYDWVQAVLDFTKEGFTFQDVERIAAQSPPGANGVLFNPSLAGGTSQDKSRNIRGAFMGLQLGTTRQDLLRAAMEGVALNLRLAYDSMAEKAELRDRLLVTGGCSRSRFWMQILADVLNKKIVKTTIDQDAASLGAAAIAARAKGLWRDYSRIPDLHRVEFVLTPDPDNTKVYSRRLPIFRMAADFLSDLGDKIELAQSDLKQ